MIGGSFWRHCKAVSRSAGVNAPIKPSRRCLPGGGKDLPRHHEDRCNQRSNDKAIQTKHLNASKRRNQHDVIGQFGTFADQGWTKDIVHHSNDKHAIGNQTDALPYGAAKGGIWGLSNVLAIEGRKYNIRIWTLAPGALTRMTADLPRYIENPKAALGPDGIAPAVLYMVSDLSGDQTGKVLGVSGPRGVREMRMMEMEGWKPPFTGWKAEDIVTHAKEIFFSEEQIKMGARRF